jgi:hypothetical protein
MHPHAMQVLLMHIAYCAWLVFFTQQRLHALGHNTADICSTLVQHVCPFAVPDRSLLQTM